MPRRKQPNGQQPIRVATGGAYGDAQAMTEAQRQMPLPQVEQVPEPPPMQRAIDAAAPVPFQMGGFAAESAYPDEPVTAGMNGGAGPGPEVLAMNRNRKRTSDTLALIASVTGDPEMAALAERARSRGL